MDVKKINKFYDHHYFNLSKKLQMWVGIWPYQTGIKKTIRRYMIYVNLFATSVPLVNGIRIWCGKDIDLCCENIIGFLYLLVIYLKLLVTRTFEYKEVAIKWLTLKDPVERAILSEYARNARLKCIAYLMYLSVAGVIFSQAPMIPVILDHVAPLNESRQKVLFIKGEYIINPFEHYYKIYAYVMLTTVTTIVAVSSIDTSYTLFTHQNLGMFSVVKHRLQMATKNYDEKSDYGYAKVTEAIRFHKDALNFIELIDTSYSFLFLVIIGGTVLFFSLASIVIISSASGLQVYDVLRLILVIIGILIHLFYLSWPGQMLIDHNNDVFLATYTNEWYNISQREKTLLSIIALKCLRPCVFTAGGLYIMNFQNFGIIIKTAISYTTVALSLRN